MGTLRIVSKRGCRLLDKLSGSIPAIPFIPDVYNYNDDDDDDNDDDVNNDVYDDICSDYIDNNDNDNCQI